MRKVEKGTEELIYTAASKDKEKTKSAWDKIVDIAVRFVNAFESFLNGIVGLIMHADQEMQYKKRGEDKTKNEPERENRSEKLNKSYTDKLAEERQQSQNSSKGIGG